MQVSKHQLTKTHVNFSQLSSLLFFKGTTHLTPQNMLHEDEQRDSGSLYEVLDLNHVWSSNI